MKYIKKKTEDWKKKKSTHALMLSGGVSVWYQLGTGTWGNCSRVGRPMPFKRRKNGMGKKRQMHMRF